MIEYVKFADLENGARFMFPNGDADIHCIKTSEYDYLLVGKSWDGDVSEILEEISEQSKMVGCCCCDGISLEYQDEPNELVIPVVPVR